jgi:hypothetical protein
MSAPVRLMKSLFYCCEVLYCYYFPFPLSHAIRSVIATIGIDQHRLWFSHGNDMAKWTDCFPP